MCIILGCIYSLVDIFCIIGPLCWESSGYHAGDSQQKGPAMQIFLSKAFESTVNRQVKWDTLMLVSCNVILIHRKWLICGNTTQWQINASCPSHYTISGLILGLHPANNRCRSLQSNAISHWLDENLESSLQYCYTSVTHAVSKAIVVIDIFKNFYIPNTFTATSGNGDHLVFTGSLVNI